MGEYVKAREIRPGDYVSVMGHGYMDYRVLDISGEHQRSKVNDEPWKDLRLINLRLGKVGKGVLQGMLCDPDREVYRTYKRPMVIISDEDVVIVNGVPVGKIVLEANVKTHEYLLQHHKREIIDGPTGYAWIHYDMEGKFLGQAVNYDVCLENMVHGALREMAKAV